MSLLRPSWLDDIIKPRPASTPRLRGLKGFDPEQVVAFQDPLYADDPTFWMLGGEINGALNNNGRIGVQAPDDSTLVTIVDGALAATDAAAGARFDLKVFTTVSSPLIVFAIDQLVLKRNRREPAPGVGVAERAGPFRIIDNVFGALGGVLCGLWRAPQNVTYGITGINYRLYRNDQFVVEIATTNITLDAIMWGRITTKGPGR